MLTIIRIVALVTMALAVFEGYSVFPEFWHQVTGSFSESAAGLSRGMSQLHGPAYLFCEGAVVYVLVHIARVFEGQ